MIQISGNIDVNRPVAQVFEFITDVNNNPKWMPVQSVQKISQGAVTNGYQFKQRFLLMGANYDLNGVFTNVELDKKISFVFDSPVFSWRGEYLFEPTVSGTRLATTGNVTLTGPLKMMETMLAPKIRKLISDTAPNLKKILES